MKKPGIIGFSIGWFGARPEQNTAIFQLKTTKQTVTGKWKGWANHPRLVEIFRQ